jgi:hypothetical protein
MRRARDSIRAHLKRAFSIPLEDEAVGLTTEELVPFTRDRLPHPLWPSERRVKREQNPRLTTDQLSDCCIAVWANDDIRNLCSGLPELTYRDASLRRRDGTVYSDDPNGLQREARAGLGSVGL